MEKNQASNLKPRPPIVVVMGHVDHGKTTLLDYIRKTNVAAREAGGITQAVGAYEIIHVPYESQTNADKTQNIAEDPRKSASSWRKSAESNFSAAGRKITFIDTPGHEAFTKMRSRGAEIADLAILVVAADESIKPQTKEAIEILNFSKTPFIVAITKTDKPSADVEKVKNDLAIAGVLLEGYGGQVSWHGISSKTGEGVNDLLDLILLSADIEGLTFDPTVPASGYILEARNDPRRGTEATVIIKNGVLGRGSGIYTPTVSGRVKILENFLGEAAEELEPSAPAVVIGFQSLPRVGEIFSSQPLAVAGKTAASGNVAVAAAGRLSYIKSSPDKPALNLILRAADAGSLEVLSALVEALKSEDRILNIVNKSVGNVTDGDVKDAVATQAIVIGFKNKIDSGAKNLSQAQAVKIITSDIVYDLVKAVEEFLASAAKPAARGELEVLAVFNQAKLSEQLVGGRVLHGTFLKTNFEVQRAGFAESAGKGKILSLRDKKTDINQAEEGREVGALANCSIQIQIGDKLIIRR